MSSSSNKEDSSATPTEQELVWAARLKEVATADGSGVDADEVSDWEFLQHAMVAKANTFKALDRLKNLQALKRRYGIIRDGSVDEAARDLRTFLQTHPGLYMSLANHSSEDEGTQVFCSEYQRFQSSRMKSEEAYAVYMRAAFYVLQASQSNVAALRAGMILLLDVYGALRYRSFQTEARARELYGKAYPIRIQRVILLQASGTLRAIYRFVLQPLLSRKVKECLVMAPSRKKDQELRDQCEDIPASSLPKGWGGDLPVDDFYDTILARLRERYQMEETFRL